MKKIGVEELLLKLNNPQVYTGREINAIRKDIKAKDFINICLVFPDKYEIGMSHYGLTILYHRLNRHPGVNAERCFLPDKESIAVFKEYDFPLFSLENKMPLKDFHLIGFSLLSELNYTNVLQVLALAGLPLFSKERSAAFPLIAAGGIGSINPEPLQEFIDIFAVGDGEVLFLDIVRVLSQARDKAAEKEELLRRLADIESIYVPALTPLEKRGRFWLPVPGRGPVQKRVFRDIDDTFPDEQTIVPIGNVVFNRLNVEIARGCPQNCRFCQAKSYYAPFRASSLEKTIDYIAGALPATGFEDFSLSTLSAGDYPYMKELLESIPRVIRPGISFSVSSLRPAAISDWLLSTISLFRRTGITIVPEAGSERLRRVINKDVSDEEIFKAVDLALHHNWQKLKLYFMIGLPTETEADIAALIRLVENIVKRARQAKKGLKIHASFSSFVPKPHTPLQWARRESLAELEKKIARIKEGLKRYRSVTLDFHNPRKGMVETVLARGDCRVGTLLLEAFHKGEIFSAWDSDFHFPAWEESIKNCNCEEFLAEIAADEALPWDFIQVNYTKEHLLKEYRKALAGQPSPGCAAAECKGCKGCAYGFTPPPNRKRKVTERQKKGEKDVQGVKYNKTRLFYEKRGDFALFSHLSMMKYIERLIRKAGIGFKCTEGFHPHIKMSALPPLPVYAAGRDEVVELFLDARQKPAEILRLLNRAGKDFTFKKVVVCNDAPRLSRDIHIVAYEIVAKNPKSRRQEILKHLADGDSAAFLEDKLIVEMDYGAGGQERFTKIYKLLDPEKRNTHNLTRTRVSFRSKT